MNSPTPTRSRRKLFRERAPHIIVLMILAGSALYWVYITQLEVAGMERHTSGVTSDIENAVEDEILDQLDLISVLSENWISTGNESELYSYDRYLELVPNFFNHSGMMLALNWIDINGVIRWIYPYEENLGVKDQSIVYFKSGEYNTAFVAAKENQTVNMTGYIDFYQGGHGFASYFPLVVGGNVTGFFNGVFDLNKMFDALFVKSNKIQGLAAYSFYLYDNETEYYHYQDNFSMDASGVRVETIHFLHFTLTIAIRPNAEIRYEASYLGTSPIIILGGVLSVVAGILAGFLKRQVKIADKIAEEKRRVEEALVVHQKMESIGVLAGGIAHDFNNLLAVIIGNLSTARLDLSEDNRDILEAISDAEEAARRARDLTSQLLSFTKPGHFVKEPFDLEGVVEEAVRFALHGSNTKYDLHVQDGLLRANADEGQIAQVVNNLVLNATEAMPEGGTIRVSLENKRTGPGDVVAKPGEMYLEMTIEDDGVGIPPENLSKIFDPYFTTKEKGHGLGLAVCYNIVKKHGGDIRVESKVGRGTRVTVLIPAVEDESPGAEEINSEPMEGKGGRILVMDDEEVIRRLLGHMLERLGYSVETAADGIEAIEKYRKAIEEGRKFDAAILDLTVPGGMGGVETMENLLKLDPAARGIVSSGYSDQPVVGNYAEHGFSAVLPKPYDIKELAEILGKLLQGTTIEYPSGSV
ncbi:MAG: ATP-binding protein [Promethearchaeota archaeon]